MYRRLVFLMSLFVISGVTGGVASADLLAQYTFEDGAATDLVGGFNGAFNGDAKVIADPEGGQRGMVLSLDGAGDYVLIPKIAESVEFTYAMWLKQAEVKSGLISLITHTSWASGSVHWGLNSGQPKIGISGAITPDGDLLGPDPIPVDEWHHLAVVKSSTLLLHYVDGVEVARRELTQSDSVILGEAKISEWDGTRHFHGLMDDIRIYDNALLEAEILSAMESKPWPYAYGPSPADGAMHSDTWVTLSWKPGALAVSHDVYIGENREAVADATTESDLFRGSQGSIFFVAGFPGYPYPDGLTPGTTYYWRVDEVNEADPNSPWKGDVWSFSIPPKTAYSPVPADGEQFVDPASVTLSWTPGFGAILHTVYFGDDYDQVNNAAGGAPLGTTTYQPGPLETEKVYYWRVDEFDAVETYKGEVWSFTTPGAVGNPRPSYQATDVGMNAILSWTPANSAASHELYFGTDKEAVRTADTGSPEYKGSKALGAESYDPGLLEAQTSYYWRVDEIDDQGNKATGPVWIFTTGAFLLVDDFEGYTDDDAAGQAIWQSWIDGFGVADNGSQVGYLQPPYAEQTNVHSGVQAMPLLYVNEAGVTNSEASMTLTAPRDWTLAGVAELSLWFRGVSANAADPLYVAVSNSGGTPAIVVNDDPGAATITEWTQWGIALQAIADGGINLTDVDKIAIGLGSNSGAASAGGSGTVYIDDIRLY
ncbi:MAG: LamG domain-containing protein [Sedimentisphaerales bacterium]|jgi:hypothetical protein